MIKITYDTWNEAQFLLRQLKEQAKIEGQELTVKPSEIFKRETLSNGG